MSDRNQQEQLPQGLAIASLILGIVSLLLSLCLGPFGIVPGLLAVVFGIVVIIGAKATPPRSGGRGMAITGLVLGILAGLIGVLYVLLFLPVIDVAQNAAKQSALQLQANVNLRVVGQGIVGLGQDSTPITRQFRTQEDIVGALIYNKINSEDLFDSAQWPSETPGSPPFFIVVPNLDPALASVNADLSDTIWLYEHPQNHAGRGGNIYYADGHAVWYDEPEYSEIIDSITLEDGTLYTPHLD